jgi:4-amino-4-deoxy-L-arabinose transferase-like glycosyltransferase
MHPRVRRYGTFSLLVLAFLFLLSYRLGEIAYFEPSEARYAEIAREMVESGDWITPHLTYIKHFDKPPLTYWITATAFKLFGANDWSGRLPLILAALFFLLYTWYLSLVLFPNQRKQASLSVLILFSSLLFLILSRSLTTDPYLALFNLGATYHLLRWFLQERRFTDAFLSAFFLGCALLTKGHVVFIFYLIPWLAAVVLYRQHRAWKPVDLLVFFGIPLVIFLPWFLAVIHDNPKLVSFFLGEQTLGRIATNLHHRSEPIYFHLAVLGVGMLFWFTYFLMHLPQALLERGNRSQGMLLLFTIIPLIIFSLNRSKLVPYLLPSLPFYAVLIAYWLATKTGGSTLRWADRVNLVLAGILVAVEILLPWIPIQGAYVPKVAWEVFAATSLVLWVYMLQGWRQQKDILRQGFAGLNLLLFFAFVTVLPDVQESFNSCKSIATAIQNQNKEPFAYRIISYRDRLPSITFYTGKRLIQIPHDRNIRFEDAQSQKVLSNYLSKDVHRIPLLLQERIPTYLVIKKDDWRALNGAMPGIELLVTEIYANPKYVVFVNSH